MHTPNRSHEYRPKNGNGIACKIIRSNDQDRKVVMTRTWGPSQAISSASAEEQGNNAGIA